MLFYREADGSVHREYKIRTVLDCIETDKALLEIVDTCEFGHALFLDGQLQMTARDEYIYHEMLVHPIMSLFHQAVRVCILGGGDGCAAREVLKWTTATTIEIVDYDQQVVQLFQHKFSAWNSQSLNHPTVQTRIESVLTIPTIDEYDVLIVDLTDPCYDNVESRSLWQELIPILSTIGPMNAAVLNIGGYLPWDETNIDWILMLVASAFHSNETHTVECYKVFVPSFAREWCFLLIKPIGTSVNTSVFEHALSIRYFDKNAWLVATSWTKNSPARLPTRPVKLKDYLPPV